MTAKLLQTIKWKQRLSSIKSPIKPTAMKLAMTLQEANDTGFIHIYTHTHIHVVRIRVQCYFWKNIDHLPLNRQQRNYLRDSQLRCWYKC